MIIVSTCAEILKDLLQDQLKDAVIIDVNHVENPDELRSSRKGLDIAAIHAATGQPVILNSFESEEALLKDERYVSLSKRWNVVLLRLPCSKDRYVEAYREVKSRRRCKGYGKECHNKRVPGYEGLCEECFTQYSGDGEDVTREMAEEEYFDPAVSEDEWNPQEPSDED